MRHNGRPRMLASRMRPNRINLRPGEPRTAACPDCDAWHGLRRGILSPHWDDWGALCPGSGQRVCLDLDPHVWARRLQEAEAQTSLRRAPTGRMGLLARDWEAVATA